MLNTDTMNRQPGMVAGYIIFSALQYNKQQGVNVRDCVLYYV